MNSLWNRTKKAYEQTKSFLSQVTGGTSGAVATVGKWFWMLATTTIFVVVPITIGNYMEKKELLNIVSVSYRVLKPPSGIIEVNLSINIYFLQDKECNKRIFLTIKTNHLIQLDCFYSVFPKYRQLANPY